MTAPFLHPITELALSEDGQATAKSMWFWGANHRHTNTDPIKVAPLEDGRLYVLDGYHRVEQVRRGWTRCREGRRDRECRGYGLRHQAQARAMELAAQAGRASRTRQGCSQRRSGNLARLTT